VFRRTLGTKVVDCCQIRNHRGNPPQDRAESLNNLAKYFSDISTLAPIPRKEIVSMASHIDSSSFSSHMQHFPSDPCLQSAPQFSSQNNEPISLEQVTSYCKTMPTNTALGCDFLSPYLLKRGTDLLFQCLHKFFLILFNLGVLPSEWLRSNIFSLYKSGDKHLPENFRPISLTPIIVRLYERLLLPKIWHILDTNQIIHPFQAGFRKNHGTLDCLYWFIQRLSRKFMQKRSYRVKPFLPVVFLDLKKAFDKISVPLMLKKLHACGIRGNLLHFFHAFLTRRAIRAIHFDEFSEWYSIDLGTPQGSVLGPILFSIYINDLICRLVALDNGIQPLGYADDLCLVPDVLSESLEATLSRLQDSLHVCSEWAKENLMTFSKDKSNLLCFRTTRMLDPFTSDAVSHLKLSGYQLGEFSVKVVDSYKYLGIKFNGYIRQLFNAHWEDLIGSVRHRVDQVCRAIDPKTTPVMVGIQLVVSIVRSKIGYSLALLSSTRQDTLTKLESLVARALKRILGLPKNAPNLASLAECGISSIRVWKEKLTLQLAHRISTLPPSHETSNQFYQHDYNLRHQRSASSRSYKSLIESLGTRVLSLEGIYENRQHSWNISNHKSIDYKELKMKELRLSYKDWINSSKGLSLAALKTAELVSFKREPYLVYDKPHISRLRARMRFNRTKTNEVAFKYKQSPSPNCPHCGDVTESLQHILMECPAYADERILFDSQFRSQYHVPLSLNIILGDFRALKVSSRTLLELLEWTGSYIEFICDKRQVY
jgi:hypothetical protein